MTQYDLFVAAGTAPPNVYPFLVNTLESTLDPQMAVGPNHWPGFSAYPSPGTFDQIHNVTAGNPWAIGEGVPIVPGDPISNAMPMFLWLSQAFGYNATLVNVFAFVDPAAPFLSLDPLGQVVVSNDSLNAYRSFLQGAPWNYSAWPPVNTSTPATGTTSSGTTGTSTTVGSTTGTTTSTTTGTNTVTTTGSTVSSTTAGSSSTMTSVTTSSATNLISLVKITILMIFITICLL